MAITFFSMIKALCLFGLGIILTRFLVWGVMDHIRTMFTSGSILWMIFLVGEILFTFGALILVPLAELRGAGLVDNMTKKFLG